MKPKVVVIFSLALNVLLALYIVHQSLQSRVPTEEVAAVQPAAPAAAPGRPTTGTPLESVPDSTVPPVRTFTWELVESPDYLEYIANLRAIGCPEETIRDIIVADVNKLYAAKKREARGEPKAFEYWKAGNPFMGQLDSEYMASARKLEEEKLAVLRQLGIEPDLKMQMGGVINAMDAMDTMFSFLPEEKQVGVMKLMQDMQADMAKAAEGGAFDGEAVWAYQRKMETAIKEMLTPEEYRDYELRMSTTANTMRSQLAGWDPDEQEFLKVFELRKAFDDQFSMFNVGNETEAEQKKRQEAQNQLNQAIKQALGEEEYAAYERGQDWTFQQTYQAAKRADLGVNEAIQVHDMKKAAEAEAVRVRMERDITQEQRDAALAGIQAETERSIKQVLGEKGWEQYNRNANTYWLRNMAPKAPPAEP